ncbi:sugar ABC transporter ATP-binding protein [Patulibacter sp. S7RM1-6]
MTATDPKPAYIALDGVSRSYGAVHALRDATIELRSGEVRALMGENGAGKSTLVKMLTGVERPNSGRVLVDGEPVSLTSTADARDAGVAVILQEPTLFPDLSVAENVVMGRHPKAAFGRIDRAAMRKTVRDALDRLGVELDPDRPVEGLSIADQQIVEIAKAMSFDARVLIMDEPTAALSGREVDRLFRVVRALQERGAAILFISHRLDEVYEISDVVTIMRDGEVVHDGPLSEMPEDELVRRMVGRDVSELFPKTEAQVGDTLLEVDGLSREGVFYDVSFEVKAGEIVALAGLVGAGRSEVVQAIFGVDQATEGRVRMNGQELPLGKPTASVAAGMALVPEDRRQQGLVMEMSIGDNATLARLNEMRKNGLLSPKKEREEAGNWAKRLQLKYGRMSDPVSTLSGGNQQKVVLAKWLGTQPRLLIIDEPTRGIDVGTKSEVHRLIDELASEGLGVLMVSSELPEVLGMADRVLVMYEGQITAELSRADATEERIVRAASGRPAMEEVA